MYKDKDKQKDANRQASQRKRDADKVKGMTADINQGMTNEGMTAVNEHTHRHTLIKPKRGKDIKCFEDLPEDVQKSINRMSINRDGTVNQTTKANRTAIAIHYQHLFPGRYYNTGVA